MDELSVLTPEQAKSTTKVYRLGAPIAYTLSQAAQRVINGVYAIPTSGYELIAYGPQEEMNKLDEFINSVKDENYDKERGIFRLISIPEETKYNRDVFVGILNQNFNAIGVSAYPGAISNQVILWGLDTNLDRAQQFVDEILKTPNEATFKTYTVQHTEPTIAHTVVARVCPNAEITPKYSERQLLI